MVNWGRNIMSGSGNSNSSVSDFPQEFSKDLVGTLNNKDLTAKKGVLWGSRSILT